MRANNGDEYNAGDKHIFMFLAHGGRHTNPNNTPLKEWMNLRLAYYKRHSYITDYFYNWDHGVLWVLMDQRLNTW